MTSLVLALISLGLATGSDSSTEDGLLLATLNEDGIHFETGVPVSFPFIRNTEPSPYMGGMFGQDIEPAGRYMITRGPSFKPMSGWEEGAISFRNPLVLWHAPDGSASYGPDGWKARLHRMFGVSGEALSRKLLELGVDGIITVQRVRGTAYTGEIIDLSILDSRV